MSRSAGSEAAIEGSPTAGGLALGPATIRRPQVSPLLLDAILLLIVFLTVRALLALAAGPPAIPYWDEYDFLRIVQRLLQTGTFQRSPETSTIALTAVYWGGLFAALRGMTLDSVRLSVQVLAFGGALILDAWLAGRGAGGGAVAQRGDRLAGRAGRDGWMAGRWPRLLVVCAVFVNPLTLGFLNTYTSDLIFVALQVAALALLIAGLAGGTRQELLLLGAGAGAGLLAFGAREIAAALLPALLAGLWLKRARPLAYLVGAGPLALALLGYFALATPARTDAGGEHIWGPLKAALAAPLSATHGLPQLAFQVGYLSIFMLEAAALALAPVAIVLAGQLRAVVPPTGAGRRFVLGAMALSALTLAAIGLLRLAGGGAPWWPLGEAVGVPLLPLDILGPPGSRLVFWVAVLLLADVSLVVLLGALAAGVAGRETRAPVVLLSVVLFASVAVMALVGSIYSRYAIALLAPLGMGAACAIRRPPSTPLLGAATALWLAGVGAGLIVYRGDRLTTAALWSAARELQAAGVPSRDIHAGYEYLGTVGVLSERARTMQPGEHYDRVVMRVEAPYVAAVGGLPPGYAPLDVRRLEVFPGVERTIVVGRVRP